MFNHEKFLYAAKTYIDKLRSNLNQLALNSNINQTTLSEIVRGATKDPRVNTLCKLSKELGVKIEEFISDEWQFFINYTELISA